MVYSYPVFLGWDLVACRIFSGGIGLGNLLFPWARAVVAARKRGFTPIFPTWRQIRPQLYLQSGTDKRTNFGFFQPTPDCIHGFRKYALLARARRWDESRWREADPGRLPGDWIVEFRDGRRRFDWLLREHDLVRQELLATTRPEHRVTDAALFRGSISVHVRLGDFVESPPSAFGAPKTRIPLEWYKRVIEDLRANLSPAPRIFLFSDGTDAELRPLLALPGAERITFGSALADLHALSLANILVASGSSYSWWASYLGRAPVIWPRGRWLEALYYEHPALEAACGRREDVPAGFYDALARRES
jgi:hypothetical protein